MPAKPTVIAVCVSNGGIPKVVVESDRVRRSGPQGGHHEHAEHSRPHRAVLFQDVELLEELRREGPCAEPGTLGENLTVRGPGGQRMAVGSRLHFERRPVLELTEPRKPCFVLGPIDSTTQQAVTGRGGVPARVVQAGHVFVGQTIRVTAAVGS